MASDILLILATEHRELLQLADRCGRWVRGFEDPEGDLSRRLVTYAQAASVEVYPSVRAGAAGDLLLASAVAASDPELVGDSLTGAARALVAVEQEVLLPLISERLHLAERRRVGKRFRLRREACLRRVPAVPRRSRSHSELYEQARRAGVENRSRMTQSQLQAAVDSLHEGGQRA